MSFKILHTEASMGWGGQEIRILREAEGMRQLGHEVFIMACPGSRLLAKAEEAEFRIHALAFRRRNFTGILRRIKAYIEEHGIDVVNTHSSKDSWLALPAARIAGNRPLAIRTRHLSTPISKGFLSRLLYMQLPHLVFTTGEAIRQQMIGVNGFQADRIISIPTGVDTCLFSPDRPLRDIREELGMPAGTPLVATVSVIRSWKGLDYFVRAVPLIRQAVPEARFLIVGEGPYREKLEKTIRETPGVTGLYQLGHRDDIADIIRSLDILVQPSYANEGVPQTVLQAMAMQKPVVASDLAALREVVIEDRTGLLVKPRDPAALAGAVIRLLGDRGLSARLGIQARHLAEGTYSMKAMLDRIEEIYASRRPAKS